MNKNRFILPFAAHGAHAPHHPDRSEYGGNTSCVTLRMDHLWIICDAGTGILSATDEICRAAEQFGKQSEQQKFVIHIFLSHLHLDHICGLPMFLAGLPKWIPVHVWGTDSDRFRRDGVLRSFCETLQSVVCPPFWPVTLQEIYPQLFFHDLALGNKLAFADDLWVTPIPAGHPDGTSNYRFELEGRTVFYGLDCEITPEFRPEYVKAAQNADILLFDGAYTEEDYERCRSFGHSSMYLAPSILQETAAKQLWVLHYDYRYTDAFLHRQEEKIKTEHSRVFFAKEGLTVTL